MHNVCLVEFIVLALIACIAMYEFVALWVARSKKLTKNISRLVTHAAIFLFAVFLAVYSVKWLLYFQVINQEKFKNVALFNWQFLAVSIAMGASMVWEFIGIYEARRSGRTKNVSRLVSHGILVLLFAVLFYTSTVKWNIYIKELKTPYLPNKIGTFLTPQHK